MLASEYLVSDPVFCDLLEHVDDSETRFPAAGQAPPPGWLRTEFDGWVAWRPQAVELPGQGWKVHVSACLDEAAEVIGVALDYCERRNVAVKFLRSRLVHLIRNEKYAPRSASGKLCTLYPVDEAQLELVLTELSSALAGHTGPYILSDLRWGAGPLYLRYGGFVTRFCLVPETGECVPALRKDDGSLVPDVRAPVFAVPPWVQVPEFVADQMRTAAAAGAAAALPYRIERALHFSNGGGVYRAADPRTGQTVVLREARPHAGLDVYETDAVTRLVRESAVLGRLAGLAVVPALLGQFTCWEHHFLVEEYIEGDLLQHAIGQRYPLIYPAPGSDDLTEYTRWALDTLQAIEAALAAVHQRGVVFGDLHPHNVILRPDGRVVLIDFEQAFDVGADRGSGLGAPGFVAPWPLTGTGVDDYAMNCLRLAFFLPLTTMLTLDPWKAPHLVRIAARQFPLPAGFVRRLLAGFASPPGWDECTWRAKRPGLCRTPDPGDARGNGARNDWQACLTSMTAAIMASATPERADRLFPGDVRQFAEGCVSVAHGAAGVLYVLAATGGPVPEEHVDWLVRAAGRCEPARPGLFGGLHGVAAVLAMLGRRDSAVEIARRAGSMPGQVRRVGLYDGLAGIGLAQLRLARATGLASFDVTALSVAQTLLAAVEDSGAADTIEPARAGLMYGWTGVAAFLVRLYEATGQQRYLEGALSAIRRDLARCVPTKTGGVQVGADFRLFLYLATGSSGIGLVLRDLLASRPDEELAAVADRISVDAGAEFAVFPGLFEGRAGLVLTAAVAARQAAGRGDRRRATAARAVAEHHLRRLDWHALCYRGHLAFPGNGMLRLSMDLATGTAGVLLASHAALAPQSADFPFLGTDLAFAGQAEPVAAGKGVTK